MKDEWSILYPSRHLLTDLWTKTATKIPGVGKTVGSGRIYIVLCCCVVLYLKEKSKKNLPLQRKESLICLSLRLHRMNYLFTSNS